MLSWKLLLGLKEYLERGNNKSWDSSPGSFKHSIAVRSTSFGDAGLTQALGSARVAKQHDSTGSGHKGVNEQGWGPAHLPSVLSIITHITHTHTHLIHNHNGGLFMLLPGKSNSYLVWIIIWVNQETKSKVRVQQGIDATLDNKSHQQTENPAQARFINVLVCDVWELLGGLFNGFSSYMQDRRANLMKLVTNMSRSFSTPKSKEPYFIWVKIIHCNTKDTLYLHIVFIILPLTHADVNEKYFKKHTHFFHPPHWTVCVWIKVYMCVCILM